jgi:ArsR family metal-binding transcriptional regulator
MNQMQPNYSRGVELRVLDIYKLLPGTNCKACDELTCLAFAVKIPSGGMSVSRCSPLFTPEHKDKRQVLFEMLRAADYPVPGVFL